MLAWYIGCRGAGKSTLAIAHAIERATLRAVPLVAIDGERDRRLAPLPLARSLDRCLHLIETCGLVRVVDGALAAELPRVLERLGGAVVLLDGAHAVFAGGAHARSADPWVRLMRVSRHARLDVLATTHHLGSDVAQVLQALAPTLFAFRVTSPAAREALAVGYGLDVETLATLPRGAFLRVATGFDDT